MRKLLFRIIKKELEKWFIQKKVNGEMIPIVFIYEPRFSKGNLIYDKHASIKITNKRGKPDDYMVFPAYRNSYIALNIVHADFKKEGLPYWDNK